MEIKWPMIAIAVIMVGFVVGQMNRDNKVAECKAAGLIANRPAAEINEVCK